MDLFEGLPATVDETGRRAPMGQVAVDRLFDTRNGTMIARHFPELRSRIQHALAPLVRAIAMVDE